MTGVLGREALEAAAIVVVTTAALAAGRADERSDVAPGHRRLASPLAVLLALAALAAVAAVAVVVVFGGAHRDVVPAKAGAAVLTGAVRAAVDRPVGGDDRSPLLPRTTAGRAPSPGARPARSFPSFGSSGGCSRCRPSAGARRR